MVQYLFKDTPIQALLDQRQRDLISELKQLSDSRVLSQTIDEWSNDFVQRYSITIPALELQAAERTYADGLVPEHPVPNPRFDNPVGVPGRMHTLHIPYKGDETLFYYQPRTYSMNAVIAGTSNGEVRIHAGGAWMQAADIDAHFDKNLKVIEESLSQLGKDIEPFNQGLRTIIIPQLTARRAAAEQTAATTAGLKYPLRKRSDAPETYKLPAKPKSITPQPAPTAQSSKEPEFALQESDYQEILRICKSMSLVMERSPTVFEKAEEEHIRVHYLVQLNGQYHGEATGETFNKIGKTDIIIRHENKNVFVAECKFWGGQKALKETVNQLLGYTTWRDTKTALIIFSRNLDFTNVISEAQSAMKDHPRYKSGPTKEGESRFRYIFKHPDDEQREIVVTLLLFNMPKPAKP